MKSKLILTSMMLMALMSCKKEQPVKEEEGSQPFSKANITVKAVPEFPVWGGGVFAFTGLSIPTNSDNFRALGGKLYIHGVGWNTATTTQKNTILNLFGSTGMGIELGWNTTPSVQLTNYTNLYGAFNITPSFITVNCYAQGNQPTLQQWKNYVNAFRNSAVVNTNRIFPTFEYANVRGADLILNNLVGLNQTFQDIITYSGGLTIDAPAAYYMGSRGRSGPNAAADYAAYRTWVVDAIKWAKARNFSVYVITSPNGQISDYNYETNRMYNALVAADAVPTGFISENYNSEVATTGQVSPENVNGSSLFVGITLLNK